MSQNVDSAELAKFASLAAHWWDPAGEVRTLHEINPLRLRYIEDICPLKDKKIIDIGCGGGILTEAMARAGGNVTGIDLNPSLIHVAKLHLLESQLDIHYDVVAAEAMAQQHPNQFDVVTCLEMLEHVPDPAAIVIACAKLVKPGGHVFFSTINRNPKSYLFAIIGAEYLLKLLPKNTHDYAKFIRPSELATWSRHAGLAPTGTKGILYQPFTKQFSLGDDISVNYLFHAVKGEE